MYSHYCVYNLHVVTKHPNITHKDDEWCNMDDTAFPSDLHAKIRPLKSRESQSSRSPKLTEHRKTFNPMVTKAFNSGIYH